MVLSSSHLTVSSGPFRNVTNAFPIRVLISFFNSISIAADEVGEAPHGCETWQLKVQEGCAVLGRPFTVQVPPL